MVVFVDFEGEKARQICSFMWADNFWILSHSKSTLEQMLRDLMEKAGMWDMVPERASLWWTSTCEPEQRSELSNDTKSGRHQFVFEEKFKISGCAMNRQEKTHDAIEVRRQSANKAYWKYFLIYKSKYIPWKIKCRRLVDHVFAVFSFGNDNWSWTTKTLERIKERETKTMLRLFRFTREKEETLVDYYARTCKTARKIWVQMCLPFLYEVIAESMWRAMGWVCYERPNAP